MGLAGSYPREVKRSLTMAAYLWAYRVIGLTD